MNKKVKLCELCRKNPAAVPDRNRMGRPIKRICRACHADRLTGDLREIMRRRDAGEPGGVSGQ